MTTANPDCNYLGSLSLLKENQSNQPKKKMQQKQPGVFFGCKILRAYFFSPTFSVIFGCMMHFSYAQSFWFQR